MSPHKCLRDAIRLLTVQRKVWISRCCHAIHLHRSCLTLCVFLKLLQITRMHQIAPSCQILSLPCFRCFPNHVIALFVKSTFGVSLNSLSVAVIDCPKSCPSCRICVRNFSSIHHFLLDSSSTDYTLTSSALTSWATHSTTIRRDGRSPLNVVAFSPTLPSGELLGFHRSLTQLWRNSFSRGSCQRSLPSTRRLVAPCGVSNKRSSAFCPFSIRHSVRTILIPDLKLSKSTGSRRVAFSLGGLPWPTALAVARLTGIHRSPQHGWSKLTPWSCRGTNKTAVFHTSTSKAGHVRELTKNKTTRVRPTLSLVLARTTKFPSRVMRDPYGIVLCSLGHHCPGSCFSDTQPPPRVDSDRVPLERTLCPLHAHCHMPAR